MLQPLSDTLSCDSALLHQYRADEAYNYARELQAPELDWWDWLMSKIGEFLSDLFSIQSKGDFRIVIYIVIALVFYCSNRFYFVPLSIQTLWQSR